MSKQIILNGVAAFLPEKHKIIAINGDQPALSLSIPASRCLSLLINYQGSVIQREHFFREVWLSNGAQVTNNTFYQNISLLRRAFKEFGLNEEYIVTVPKVGIKLENMLKVEHKETQEELLVYEPIIPPPSLPMQGSPPVMASRKPSLLRQGWVAASALLLVLCLGSAFVTWKWDVDKRFSQFTSLGVYNGCTYFVNPDIIDDKKHRDFARDFILNCERFRYVYLTAYNNFARFSAVACLRPFSYWRDNHCLTHYVLTDIKNGPAK